VGSRPAKVQHAKQLNRDFDMFRHTHLVQAMDTKDVEKINPEWRLFRFSQRAGNEVICRAILTHPRLVGCVQALRDAGFDLRPDWAKKCLVLVPLTENDAVAANLLDFEKWHLVVHRDDVEYVADALSGFSRKTGARLCECLPVREADIEESVKGVEGGGGANGSHVELKQTEAWGGGNCVVMDKIAEPPERQ